MTVLSKLLKTRDKRETSLSFWVQKLTKRETLKIVQNISIKKGSETFI